MASRRGGKCQTLTGKTFLLFTDTRTWSDAWSLCNSQGYRLLHVDNPTTLKALAANDSIWIGLSKEEDSQDKFYWDDCTALNSSFTNWHRDEPRDQDTNACVYMDTATFMWRADSCNNDHQYLCEKDTGACVYTYGTATCEATYISIYSKVEKQEDCEELCNTEMLYGNFCWIYLHFVGQCTLYFDEDPFRCTSYPVHTDTYGFRKCFSFVTQSSSGTSVASSRGHKCTAATTSASTSATTADTATTTISVATTDDATTTTIPTTATTTPTTTNTLATTTETTTTTATDATTTTSATTATSASATVTTSSVTTTATTASDKSTDLTKSSSSRQTATTATSDSTTANPGLTSPTRDGATTFTATGSSAVTNIGWLKTAANTTSTTSTTSAPSTNTTVTIVHADTTTVTSRSSPSLASPSFTSTTPNAVNSNPTSSFETPSTSTAIVTSQVSKTATSSIQSRNVSCPCMICIPVKNMTLIDDFVKDMIDWLKVDQSTLSSKRRMRESEPDDRPSAQVIGYGGTLFLVFTFSIVVMVDISRICHVRNKRMPETQKKKDP
ncbi:mucin-3A-like [Haliotis rubra]|uniref:mucin-3A-like n=1 Tax=Haliotis rubra TaxID=36100 RepID=UPI001EE5FC52|nr:mucin-3A-like [Haliotis rubra]